MTLSIKSKLDFHTQLPIVADITPIAVRGSRAKGSVGSNKGLTILNFLLDFSSGILALGLPLHSPGT